jgi:heme-degrading monooxygenase HmoA
VWRDRSAFEKWRDSEKPAGKSKAAPEPPVNLYARPPVPTFYEGILMLESAEGI